MKIALAGQPNCGKSTIFNHIAGYKAITSNFPGTTVKYTETKTHINGYTCNCIDLPGTYSLTSSDPAELEARKHLLSGEVDVIINVIDASLLCRSLELTLQLLELEVPMILCLNMMDEAQRKGIQIDAQKLSNLLGVPVISTIATTGKGLKELFIEVLRVREERRIGKTPKFSKDIEEIVSQLDSILNSEWPVKEKVPPRFLSIKLLENDEFFISETKRNSNAINRIRPLQEKLEQIHGGPSDEVISSERHALTMNLFEKVSTLIHPPKKDIRNAIDHWVMHKFFGYLILVGVFYGFFNLIFG
ncbi:MAG: FeoB small GTPase domain-containing protein, partial [Thermodesulfobacteriota bacterium]|nr:FeoB small GTPase domain-containing protein [Thermodesulfobacteriota bacterium]